jgi:hypothetical protein
MGTLMIKCPNTGRAISTGMMADRSRFGSTPVFYSRTYCPICRINHDWFAAEAWVHDPSPPTRPDMKADSPILAVWAMRARRRGQR